MKDALVSAPVLQFPDYTVPFIIYTDASDRGLGAALMQPDSRGKLSTVAYGSRTVNKAESNYSVTHLEALAVVWGLQKSSDILYGYSITVFIDYTPITNLFKSKNLSERLARWFLIIQVFNPIIKHAPCRANVVADALSRYVGSVVGESPRLDDFSVQQLAEAQCEHRI